MEAQQGCIIGLLYKIQKTIIAIARHLRVRRWDYDDGERPSCSSLASGSTSRTRSASRGSQSGSRFLGEGSASSSFGP